MVTQGPPVHSRAHWLSAEKLALTKQEFNKMLDMGIIRRSSSPWVSPLQLVPKPSGGWCTCADYHRLNAIQCQIAILSHTFRILQHV